MTNYFNWVILLVLSDTKTIERGIFLENIVDIEICLEFTINIK